ncbi:MAG: RHS repeat-associated core domain-containing protein, partial [Gammaproteobacteria bacterium]
MSPSRSAIVIASCPHAPVWDRRRDAARRTAAAHRVAYCTTTPIPGIPRRPRAIGRSLRPLPARIPRADVGSGLWCDRRASPWPRDPRASGRREYDKASWLYYYRARYYNLEVGRFLTRDPIGFAGGDTNLYRYVLNDPITRTDPRGLRTLGRGRTLDGLRDWMFNEFESEGDTPSRGLPPEGISPPVPEGKQCKP